MRRDDWRVRLQDHITKWRDQPFVRGEYDCAIFAADAVRAMTDVDIADGLRGYDTEEEGLELIGAKGFDGLTDVFAHYLPRADRLKHGDVAVIERDGLELVGIAQGRGIYVMTLDHGLALVPNAWASGGFSV